MREKISSFRTSFLTLLLVCAFSMPAICVSAHTNGKSLMTAQMEYETEIVQKIDVSKNGKQGKSLAHHNCCFGHHCCAAKPVLPVEVGILFPQSRTAKVSIYVTPNILGLNIAGLYRPPKYLV